MDEKIDEISEEIARTRADLNEKLGAFEGQIREEVSSVKENMEGVISNVKTVAKQLSLAHYVRERPMIMLGGSMLSGFLITRWWVTSGAVPLSPAGAPLPPKPSLVRLLADAYPDEARALKTMAFSYAVSFIAKRAVEALPNLAGKIEDLERQLIIRLDSDETK